MNSTINNTLHVSQKWLDFWNRSPATIAAETSTFLLIGLIAIVGNLLVVISIYRNPSLRTITNYFVLSLAMTDILYPITVLPLTVVSSATSRYDLGGGIPCKIQAISALILLNISLYIMAVMAVNRYVCVCKQHKYKKWFNKKTCLILIIGGWIVYCVLGLFIETSNIVYIKFFPRKIICNLSRSKKTISTKITGNFILTFAILLPFSIITFCYFKIFKKIREHKNNVAPASNRTLGTNVQEIKVTWTMFAVVMGFVLTWVPALVLMLISSHYKNSIPREVHTLVTYLTSSSSTVNPVMYGAMNPMLRKEYKRIIRCLRDWNLEPCVGDVLCIYVEQWTPCSETNTRARRIIKTQTLEP